MKKILFIFFMFLCYFIYGQNKRNLENKIDSLIIILKRSENKKVDSTIIKIDKLDEVFKRTEPNLLDKYLPSLIALLTVAISSTVVYKIGIKNSNTQLTNAESQLRTQTAIALDQIEIARKQIEQNTKNTLAQIRANNISKARIEWVQNLRLLLSDFFGNISEASDKMNDMIEAKKDEEKTQSLYNQIVPLLHKMQTQSNQINLYLNPENITHKELLDSIYQYMETITARSKNQEGKNEKNLSEDVILKSRIVLKEAWEKAKIESENIAV